MTEQMAQMVTPVKTTAWGGLHNSLALVLDDTEYAIVTRNTFTMTNCIVQPPAVHPNITDTTTPTELHRLQAKTTKFQQAFDLQQAITITNQHWRPTHHQQCRGTIRQGTQRRLRWLSQSDNQGCPHPPMHQMVQGHDEGAHGRNGHVLPLMGPTVNTHHHVRPPINQTPKEVSLRQRHHL